MFNEILQNMTLILKTQVKPVACHLMPKQVRSQVQMILLLNEPRIVYLKILNYAVL